MKKEDPMKTVRYTYVALALCLFAFAGAVNVQAMEVVAPSQAQTATSAPIALVPVTITDHGETLTMLLPQMPAFQKEEQSFPAIGFSISKYTARVEAAGRKRGGRQENRRGRDPQRRPMTAAVPRPAP